MKRILSCILSLLVLLTGIAPALAAGEPHANPDTLVLPINHELPLTGEPVSIEVLFPRSNGHGDLLDNWYVNQLEEKTGIRIVPVPVEESGWTEKKNLVLASGDYTDIFMAGLTWNDALIYGEMGIFQPLEDLIAEHAPNVMTLLEKYPEAKKTLTMNGHIYVLPTWSTPARELINNENRKTINTKWLENVGMEMPKTLDELYAVLKAFKEQDANGNGDPNDEIPYTNVFNGEKFEWILSAFGFVNLRHDVLGEGYVYVPAHENYRHYLEFMNKLYSEGLLDEDYFIQTTEELQVKVAAGVVGSGITYATDYTTDLDLKFQYSNVSPLISEYNNVLCWPKYSVERTDAMLAITDKCKNPELILKLLDYWYSEEGSFQVKGGPKLGEMPEDLTAGYEKLIAEDGTVTYKQNFDKEKFNSFYLFRKMNGLWAVPHVYTDELNELVVGADPDRARSHQESIDSGCYGALRLAYPNAAFNIDETDALATYVMIDSYADQMTAKFITGEEALTDESWAAYVATLEGMGLSARNEIYQIALDRWNGK
ncbi:MAG: extracellular solute-binding protein [Clostridia bacterium]|nr:extracellular solute-binding protein [Clostridia bacterium]